LELVKYENEDYPLILEWFAKYNWAPCDADCFPVNTYFAVKDGRKLALSCFMATDSTIAFMGITLTNRDEGSPAEQSEAVDFLLKEIAQKAKEQGYNYLYNFTESRAMVYRFRKQGFRVANRGISYSIVGDLTNTGRTKFFEE
jgi:hypothetical protein